MKCAVNRNLRSENHKKKRNFGPLVLFTFSLGLHLSWCQAHGNKYFLTQLPKPKDAQIPCTMPRWWLNFVRWRQLYVGPQYVPLLMSPFWHLEVAPRFWETSCTTVLSYVPIRSLFNDTISNSRVITINWWDDSEQCIGKKKCGRKPSSLQALERL